MFWSHFKRAALPESKGGCESDEYADVELGDIVPIEDTTFDDVDIEDPADNVRRVESAVDDAALWHS